MSSDRIIGICYTMFKTITYIKNDCLTLFLQIEFSEAKLNGVEAKDG